MGIITTDHLGDALYEVLMCDKEGKTEIVDTWWCKGSAESKAARLAKENKGIQVSVRRIEPVATYLYPPEEPDPPEEFCAVWFEHTGNWHLIGSKQGKIGEFNRPDDAADAATRLTDEVMTAEELSENFFKLKRL